MAADRVIPAAFVKAVHDAAPVHAPGWKVSTEATGWPEVPTKVLLEHPLSNGHQILFKP